jgi:LysR family hydrogen peroxide-inducible transcriptional activator
MELHQLRYFLAVARSGNFTRGAAQVRVAQPSLFQQILKLEDELGARLFDRLGREARLTSFGRAFLPRAEAILRDVGDAIVEIREMAGDERGRVVLGVIPTIAPYCLPEWLATFARRHSEVSVSVLEETTPLLLDRLRNGTADAALLALPVPGREFATTELFREQFYAAVAVEHPLASLRAISLRQLEGEPFLLLKEDHCFREHALAACRRSRLHPRVVFGSGQFSSVLAMVAAKAGVSLVPRMAAEKRSGVRSVPVEDAAAFRRIGIARLRRHYPSRAQCLLLDHLAASALPLAQPGL